MLMIKEIYADEQVLVCPGLTNIRRPDRLSSMFGKWSAEAGRLTFL